MKKLMIAIFAHPDDEAFGPSGTLLKLRDEGTDLHLILLTDGEGGTNSDNLSDLGMTRLDEWQSSAALLGATTTHALHYPDGGLEHLTGVELDQEASDRITEIMASYATPPLLSFMTFEPLGLTGHHDHIAASHLTTRMAHRFAARDIWYFCLSQTQAPLSDAAYYEPRAREDTYITDRIDITAHLSAKYRVIDAHVSQHSDGATMKKLGDVTEHFHIDRL